MKAIKKSLRKLVGHALGLRNHEGEIGNKGERVDIDLRTAPKFWQLDIYQKNHLRRYEFAVAQVTSQLVCADMACGSGYGSYLLAKKAKQVLGFDIDPNVVEAISVRYNSVKNLEYLCRDLRNIEYVEKFDVIVSFETIEHVDEASILTILSNFHRALKSSGKLIFSVPLRQKDTKEAREMGFHKTFNIDEQVILGWLGSVGLRLEHFFYQDYKTHEVRISPEISADFVICVACK